MNVLIAGGSGFVGTALGSLLKQENHDVYVLTRRRPGDAKQIQWDGRTAQGWGQRMNEMDAVVNLTGFGLEHWPWTRRQKEKFESSRVLPGQALVSAIEAASRRPRVFLQVSGINHYGLRGEDIADEATPVAHDYLAQLTVKWEDHSIGGRKWGWGNPLSDCVLCIRGTARTFVYSSTQRHCKQTAGELAMVF